MKQSTLVLISSLTAFVVCSSPALADSDALAALNASFRIAGGESSGTGFAVAMPSADKDVKAVVLVTAAHTFAEMKQESCQLVLREKQEDGRYIRKEQTVPIRAGKRPKWRKHPDLDIAVLPITLPEGVAITPFSLDQIADESFLKSDQIQVGQRCFVPCFPAKLEANSAGWPVLRRGSIASYPLHPVAKDKTFLLDYSSFGGDSGAPVVARAPTGRLDVDESAKRNGRPAGGRDANGDGKHGSGDIAWFLAVDPSKGGDVLSHPGGRLIDTAAGLGDGAEQKDQEGDGIAGHWGGLLWWRWR